MFISTYEIFTLLTEGVSEMHVFRFSSAPTFLFCFCVQEFDLDALVPEYQSQLLGHNVVALIIGLRPVL